MISGKNHMVFKFPKIKFQHTVDSLDHLVTLGLQFMEGHKSVQIFEGGAKLLPIDRNE